jgi:branched-subunit amino acid aminotransferase/4-amino-4-deoxychorismate lyase
MRLDEREGEPLRGRQSPVPPERTLIWREHEGLAPVRQEPGGTLLAADSWLFQDGRVRGLDRHRGRFFAACAEAAGEPAEHVAEFWRQAVAALPRTGDWFPRVELVKADVPEPARPTCLYLRIRPAPARTTELTVWPAEEPDARTHPRRKGPDVALLAAVRAAAVRRGAQETLLTAPCGAVLEGTTTSLLWWEENTLCLPSSHLPVLPGVTSALIQERAAELDVSVEHRRRTVHDLEGHEVWLVNALHGIRPVTAWLGGTPSAGPVVRAPLWQTWLQDVAEPVHGQSTTRP